MIATDSASTSRRIRDAWKALTACARAWSAGRWGSTAGTR